MVWAIAGMTMPPINLWTYAMALAACHLIAREPLQRLHKRAGCWTGGPKKHPWHSDITDMACGYDHKLTDPQCLHCHRQRDEQPHEQIPSAPGLETGDK